MSLFDIDDPNLKPRKQPIRAVSSIRIPKPNEEITLGTALWFGKHYGKTIQQVLDEGQYQWILWAIDNVQLKLTNSALSAVIAAQDDHENMMYGDYNDLTD